LEGIPAADTFAVAQRLKIEEGVVRPFDGKTEVMKREAGTIDAVAHGLLPTFVTSSLSAAT
jgi:hypothetical protein